MTVHDVMMHVFRFCIALIAPKKMSFDVFNIKKRWPRYSIDSIISCHEALLIVDR